ncbi:MAG: DUF1499 domain-containing protein [Nitrospirae bacterium]|nr:DUF1499 domain-containing protein [Nitrospirota bacterium]
MKRLTRLVSRFGVYGLGLAALAGVAMMLAGVGSRLGWWHFRMGFLILTGGGYLALFAACLSLAGLIRAAVARNGSGSVAAACGLALGLAVAWVPWSWQQTAKRVPAIHDITTDTGNPPQFVAILPLRKDAANPVEYGGPDVAKLQQFAYPDIVPASLLMTPEEAFDRALKVVGELGWRMVAADRAALRIEAVDTTRWFGFKDDIVIRITPEEKSARVDIRSVSRVGKSDVGANAKRIRKFLEKL